MCIHWTRFGKQILDQLRPHSVWVFKISTPSIFIGLRKLLWHDVDVAPSVIKIWLRWRWWRYMNNPSMWLHDCDGLFWNKEFQILLFCIIKFFPKFIEYSMENFYMTLWDSCVFKRIINLEEIIVSILVTKLTFYKVAFSIIIFSLLHDVVFSFHIFTVHDICQMWNKDINMALDILFS